MEQFLLGVTQHLTEFAINAEVSAFGRDLRHPDGLKIEQRAKLFLAPAQLLFDSPSLGHILLSGCEMRHFTALVANRPGGPFEMKFKTILAVIDRLAVVDLARHTILAQLAEYAAVGFRPLQDVGRF